jgi:hypothetical protein
VPLKILPCPSQIFAWANRLGLDSGVSSTSSCPHQTHHVNAALRRYRYILKVFIAIRSQPTVRIRSVRHQFNNATTRWPSGITDGSPTLKRQVSRAQPGASFPVPSTHLSSIGHEHTRRQALYKQRLIMDIDFRISLHLHTIPS